MSNKYIILFVLSSILLTGCAQVPNEVKEEISNYEIGQPVSQSQVVTIPFSEVTEQSKMFLKNNTTNITVENLIVPQSKKTPSYRVDFNNDKLSDLFTKLQSEPLFKNNGNGVVVSTQGDVELWMNNLDYCFTAFPGLNGANYYRNTSDVMISDWGTYYGQNMRMTDSGCITLYCDDKEGAPSSPNMYSVVKRYYNDFEEERETYQLYDGTLESVSDISQFTENFCNNNLKESENNLFDYQVNYVDVRNIGKDTFGFYVSLSRTDTYGNRFDATKMYMFDLEEFENRNALIASPIHMWITSSDCISEFEKNYTFTMTEINENENIVSLNSAVDILSNMLAQGKSYSFQTAELKYIFEIAQSDYINAAREYVGTEEYKENMYNVVYSPESVYAYGEYEIIANPYWVFTAISASDTDTNCGEIYMVNALDGSFRAENVDEYGNLRIHY